MRVAFSVIQSLQKSHVMAQLCPVQIIIVTARALDIVAVWLGRFINVEQYQYSCLWCRAGADPVLLCFACISREVEPSSCFLRKAKENTVTILRRKSIL